MDEKTVDAGMAIVNPVGPGIPCQESLRRKTSVDEAVNYAAGKVIGIVAKSP